MRRIPLCRHCHRKRVNRPKGLCWVCYYAPGVKERYGHIAPCGRRSDVPDFCRAAPLPEPTPALPGSAEKVAVLADRARKGLALHHPLDAGWTEAGKRVGAMVGQVEEDDEE